MRLARGIRWVAVTAVLALSLILTSIAGCGGQDFSSENWRGTPYTDCYLREYRKPMVSDLLKHRLSEGMTRAEVRELLGPYDFKDVSYTGVAGWDYAIGLDGSDCAFVFVGFDDRGQVVEWFDSRSSR